MYSRTIARVASGGAATSLAEVPPVFLAPAIYGGPQPYSVQTATFSTSGPLSARIKGDRNRLRGVSAIHRTGPRAPLEVSRYPLPTPVPRKQQPARKLNPNHGLWKFFNKDRQAFPPPEEDYAHGRAWSVAEIRQKSWEDLHSLWWVCVLERNRIATARQERQRASAGYGDFEADEREKTIRRTQSAIKHVLRERWYAWQEARELYNSGYRPEEQQEAVEKLEQRRARGLEKRKAKEERQNRGDSESNAENAGVSE